MSNLTNDQFVRRLGSIVIIVWALAIILYIFNRTLPESLHYVSVNLMGIGIRIKIFVLSRMILLAFTVGSLIYYNVKESSSNWSLSERLFNDVNGFLILFGAIGIILIS